MKREDQLAALAALRRELGSRIQTGAECLLRSPSTETRAPGAPGTASDDPGSCLRRGQITEFLAPLPSCGAGLAMAALLAGQRREGGYAVLFDIGGGFTADGIPERDLEALLWIGCPSLETALAAFDIAARDGNFDLFLLDGRECAAEDWRSVPAARWHRILHSLRRRDARAAVFARTPATGATKRRLELVSRYRLADLHRDRSELLPALRPFEARLPLAS